MPSLFLVLLVLVTDWGMSSSQVKKHVQTIYDTFCFSPCFCRLQLCSMLCFHYAFPTAKIPNPTISTTPLVFQRFSLLHWLLLCYQLFLLYVLPVAHYPLTFFLPFSVAVLLSSPSSGQDDRLTETDACHASYVHGKGLLNNTQALTAGLKDVSYLVDLLQSPWWCHCLLECVNYGWHENELWGATSWEPAAALSGLSLWCCD